MTDIQIRYWDYKEGARHNLATEGLTQQYNTEYGRHNVQTEILGFQTLDESKRHNVQTETLGFKNLEETVRHNVESENIGYIQARASSAMASASMIQAQAATSQAQSAALRSQSEVLLNTSKRNYQNIQNDIASKTEVATIAGAYVGIVGDLFKVAGSAAMLAAL